jgi:hypothetical protein
MGLTETARTDAMLGMNMISLPSGALLNLDQIAFVQVVGRVLGQAENKASLAVNFSAGLSAGNTSRPVQLNLEGPDAIALLNALSGHGIDVQNTATALKGTIYA